MPATHPFSLASIQRRLQGATQQGPAPTADDLSAVVTDWLRGANRKDENIVGCGFGRKIRGGLALDQVSWTVFVKRKLPRPPTEKDRLPVPEEIAGFPTDVVAVGEPYLLGCVDDKLRPVPGGVSVGPALETGTLGGWAWRDAADGAREWFGLSNNHVLSRWGKTAAGDPIGQPGKADCFAFDQSRVGAFERAVDLDPNTLTLRVDAALFRPDDPQQVDPAVLGMGGAPTTWRRREDVFVGQGVRKHGRTTALTGGAVSYVGQSVVFTVDGFGLVTLEDQIACDLPSLGGDSGSLLFAKKGRSVLGLVCARAGHLTIASPIQHVQELLEVQVAPKQWKPT